MGEFVWNIHVPLRPFYTYVPEVHAFGIPFSEFLFHAKAS